MVLFPFWVLHSSGFRNYVEFCFPVLLSRTVQFILGKKQTNKHSYPEVSLSEADLQDRQLCNGYIQMPCCDRKLSFYCQLIREARSRTGMVTSEPKAFCLPFSSLLVNSIGPDETAAHRFLSHFFFKKNIIKEGACNETSCIINLTLLGCTRNRLNSTKIYRQFVKAAVHIRRYIRATLVLICHSITRAEVKNAA